MCAVLKPTESQLATGNATNRTSVLQVDMKRDDVVEVVTVDATVAAATAVVVAPESLFISRAG